MRLLILFLVMVSATLPAHAFEIRRMALEHDGQTREALIDAPRQVQDAPLLIVLHGGLAGPLTVRRRAKVTLASKGWVVAWPSAIDDWNDGRVNAEGVPYDNADDIGFLRSMVAELAELGWVDPNRVFVAGPSIGGVMALRLLCDAPDLIAGVAVAIASFPQGTECQDGPARPVIYLHGTDDDIMPPNGGRIGGWSPLIRDRGYVRSVAETLDHIVARNACDGFVETPLADRVQDDGSTVVRRIYSDCAEPVVHYVIQGGGHTWPGAPSSRISSFVGPTNRDISATRVVEDFFQQIANAR